MDFWGLVSRAGVITNSYTFDHCGPLTRTVEDAALVLQALNCTHHSGISTSLLSKGRRLLEAPVTLRSSRVM